MASLLEIYKTELTPERNALIENIEEYLATKSELVYQQNYQYARIELETTFSITANQKDYNSMCLGNYVRLVQEGRIFYYFVNKTRWAGVNSCKLDCTLDTINTFNEDLEWSDKTNVIREHRDRFKTRSKKLVVDRATGLLATPNMTKTYTFFESSLRGARVDSLDCKLSIISGTGSILNSRILEFDSNTGRIKIQIEFSNNIGLQGQLNITFDYTKIVRDIDFTPEGVNPQLFGQDLGVMYDNKDTDSWYVIYNSTGDSKAIETLLCKDTPINTFVASSEVNSASLTASELEQGVYYFVDPYNGLVDNIDYGTRNWTGIPSTQRIFDGSDTELYKTGYSYDIDSAQYLRYNRRNCCMFTKEGNSIGVYSVVYSLSGTYSTFIKSTLVEKIATIDSIKVNSDVVFKVFKGTEKPTTTNNIDTLYKFANSPILDISDTKEAYYVSSFNDLDKTVSTLIKVIKLPYCPISYKIKNGKYEFLENISKSTAVNLGGKFIKIANNAKFELIIANELNNPLQEATKYLNYNEVSVENTKDIKYESKLYNSEFYKPKFLYDSFGIDFELEKIRKDIEYSDKLVVDFKASRLFNSSFMFKFPEYETTGKDNEDYNNILIVNRNNEVPIYSSAYLDYVRNGYNFDVKNKNQNTTMNIIGGALRLGGSTSPQGAVLNTIGSIANTIGNHIQAERNIEQKIVEKKAQSIGISNADSIDLLQAYSENKAKLKLYKASDRTRAEVYDMFYYTGYSTNIRKVPDMSSRYWFNYIECEPVFKGTNISVYNDFLENIRDRYKSGVTVYHYHPESVIGYDLDQEYENWETKLIGA